MAKKASAKRGGRVTPKKSAPVRSSAADFKKGSALIDLELPSGLVVGVRRPQGITAFLTGGQIPNSLLPILQDAIDGKEPDEESLLQILQDSSKLADMMAMVDSLVVMCVVEPPVASVPAPGEYREDDIVYTDEMADDDKMFIMQFAMAGAKDLETFRSEQASTLDAMANVKVVSDPTVAVDED